MVSPNHRINQEPNGLDVNNLLVLVALTSDGFLRGLRSLTILAFLAGFFLSSLSPSLLDELAEALLSNLYQGKVTEE